MKRVGGSVLGVVECVNEKVVPRKGTKSHHVLPRSLINSQRKLLKVQLQSFHSSDYFGGLSLHEDEG